MQNEIESLSKEYIKVFAMKFEIISLSIDLVKHQIQFISSST